MTNVIDLSWERAKRIDEQSLCIVMVKTDRHNANRNYYLITGDREQDVQAEINWRIAEAESFGGGYGIPYGPVMDGGRWIATIEMVVRPDKWIPPDAD